MQRRSMKYSADLQTGCSVDLPIHACFLL
jgi:hypothetical protein